MERRRDYSSKQRESWTPPAAASRRLCAYRIKWNASASTERLRVYGTPTRLQDRVERRRVYSSKQRELNAPAAASRRLCAYTSKWNAYASTGSPTRLQSAYASTEHLRVYRAPTRLHERVERRRGTGCQVDRRQEPHEINPGERGASLVLPGSTKAE